MLRQRGLGLASWLIGPVLVHLASSAVLPELPLVVHAAASLGGKVVPVTGGIPFPRGELAAADRLETDKIRLPFREVPGIEEQIDDAVSR